MIGTDGKTFGNTDQSKLLRTEMILKKQGDIICLPVFN